MLTLLQRLCITALFIIIPTAPGEAPKGTKIEVRLNAKLASESAKVGDPIEGVIIAPVKAADRIVISAGDKVLGKIKEVKSTEGKADQRASVLLEFSELVSAAGKKTKVSAKVVGVDNVRESVDDQGAIVGILASETMSSRIDQGLGKLQKQSSALADLLSTIKKSILKEPQPEIDYPAGTEMTLELTENLKAGAVAESDGPFEKVKALGDSRLAALVNSEPFRTYAQSPPKPSDIANLMFLGSQKEIEAAFVAAGWSDSAMLNSQSGMETFRALAENRGYKEAPVSILLLDGQKPDIVFQKSTNTFEKRHHVRVWRRPGSFSGKEIWVSSSTHDMGIEFSPQNRTFIHKIDSNIDNERTKVVNDLIFSGHIKAFGLVERTHIPKDASNATGDKLVTDGKMAVLEFQ